MTYKFFTPSLLSRIGILVVVFALFSIGNPNFATLGSIFSIMEGFALFGLIAAGVAATMLVGELDLSIGSVAAVAGILAVSLTGLGLLPAVLITAVIAVVYGILQGWIIVKTGINSLVFTLATLILIRGVAFILTPESVIMPMERIGMSDFLVTRLWIFTPFSLFTIIVITALGLFLGFNRWGREMMSFGGGRNEARAAGVNTRRPVIVAFAICAACAALAGSFASIKSASAAPFSYESWLLTGVTAALVGGVSLYGGKGTMFGVVIGVLIIRTLTAGISSRGAAIYVEALATGVVLLIVLIMEFLTESPQRRAWSERRAFEKQLVAPA